MAYSLLPAGITIVGSPMHSVKLPRSIYSEASQSNGTGDMVKPASLVIAGALNKGERPLIVSGC